MHFLFVIAKLDKTHQLLDCFNYIEKYELVGKRESVCVWMCVYTSTCVISVVKLNCWAVIFYFMVLLYFIFFFFFFLNDHFHFLQITAVLVFLNCRYNTYFEICKINNSEPWLYNLIFWYWYTCFTHSVYWINFHVVQILLPF